MQKTIAISLMVGTGALLLSIAMILVAVPLLGDSFQKTMFVNSVIGCYSIGSPVTYYYLRQADNLRVTNLELERLQAELAAANCELSRKVQIDEMTGLLNRAHFLGALNKACDTGKTAGAPGSAEKTDGAFLIIDADNFKQINDQWGHQAGDAALVQITSAIKSAVRDSDLVGRIGGEEFAVFLPGADQSGAMEVAERIRVAVRQISFRPEERRARHRLSVSIGGVSDHRFSAPSTVMGAADANLYKAKRAGRNRIVFSGPQSQAA